MTPVGLETEVVGLPTRSEDSIVKVLDTRAQRIAF